MISWATAKANPLLKAAACKADASTVKKAISMMPDAMLAKMIQSSSMCQTGGKRKTRKQKRKNKTKSKTRRQ
jgi:hypothetical protein